MKAQIISPHIRCLFLCLCIAIVTPGQGVAGYILDPGFAGGGKRTDDIGNFNDRAFDGALQADGKYVVAGTTENEANTDIAVLRYLSDGTLDTGFNGDGMATFPDVGSGNDGARGVTVLENGNILVAGYSENDDGDREIVVLRLTSSGFLDIGFGVSGVARLTLDDLAGEATDLVIDSKNRILVSATVSSDSRKWAAVARFEADGTLDRDFGNSGLYRVEFSESEDDTRAELIAIQTNGRILLGGTTSTGAQTSGAVFRVTAGGGPDLLFGGDGIAELESGYADSAFYGVALQENDNFIVAGYATVNGRRSITTARFDDSGALKLDYGADGVALYDIGNDSIAHGIVEQDDSTLLVFGEGNNNSNDSDVVLVELNADGSKKTSTVLTSEDYFQNSVNIEPLEVADGLSLADYELVAMQQESQPLLQDVNGDNDSGRAIMMRADGGFVIAGFASDGINDDIALLGFTSDVAIAGQAEQTDIEDIPYLIATLSVSNVTRNSAMSGGVISENGLFECSGSTEDDSCLPTITERGVVFGITPFPSYRAAGDDTTTTTDGDGDTDSGSVFPSWVSNTAFNYDLVRSGQTSDGTGKGTYGSDIYEITPDAVYYVRAYAVLTTTTGDTSENVIIYGNQLSFRTDDACFIATAAYGTALASHVKVLSAFRDKYLKSSAPGKLFVRLYYHFSPPLAEFIAESEILRFCVRILLLPLVALGYSMVHLGILATLGLALLLGGTCYGTNRLLLRR